MSGISITRGNSKIEFGVTTIPNRKRKALYATRGCMVEVLAYFTSDDNADRFQTILDYIIMDWENKK